jgi:hypothetical protein
MFGTTGKVTIAFFAVMLPACGLLEKTPFSVNNKKR